MLWEFETPNIYEISQQRIFHRCFNEKKYVYTIAVKKEYTWKYIIQVYDLLRLSEEFIKK